MAVVVCVNDFLDGRGAGSKSSPISENVSFFFSIFVICLNWEISVIWGIWRWTVTLLICDLPFLEIGLQFGLSFLSPFSPSFRHVQVLEPGLN